MAELLEKPLNSTGLLTALRVQYLMRRPAMVMGPPGIGKSRLFKQLAKKLGIELKDVRALLMNPVDVNGLPHVQYRSRAMEQLAKLFNTPGDTVDMNAIAQVFAQTSEVDLYGKTIWSRPGFLPADGAGILLFDELNAASVEVMAALYQVMLDFQIGDHLLGAGWVPFAAGNRTTDRGVAHKMPTPLRDRLFFYDMIVEWQPWADWAVTDGDIHPLVIAYLEYSMQDYGAGISDVTAVLKEKLGELLTDEIVSVGLVQNLLNTFKEKGDEVGCGMLHRFNPKSEDRSFPTPRSWEMVSDAIKVLEQENLTGTEIEEAMIAGKVGLTAAKEICAYASAFRLGFTIGDVLTNPDTAMVPDEPSMQCGVMNALARAASDSNIATLGQYMHRLPEEMQFAFVKRVTSRDVLLNKTPWVNQFRIQHADIYA